MRKCDQVHPAEILAIAGQFVEFDQFVEFTAGWDIDFRQVGRGLLNATLSQAVGKSWSLAKARFDRPAYQQGVAVSGMRTFAILDQNAPETEWCGRSFSSQSMVVFADDGEFKSISKPGFDVYTLSFTDEQLATACERLGIPDITESLVARGVMLRIDPRQAEILRKLVSSSLQALCKSGLPGSGWVDSDHIRDKIAEHLVMLLTESSYLTRTPPQRNRSLEINRALEVIENGLEKAISVREVVKASRISRRSLEYAFRDRYGFSPKAFINSQRLVRVRRDLLSESGTIGNIANRWGYWHMGQFARDYQLQFDELPSQTRKRH